MSEPEPERLRQSPEFRRRQILDAARRLLAADPTASIQDIAAAAGVTRQLVSLYFPGGGTGPVFAALFDDFIVSLPDLFEGAFDRLAELPEGWTAADDPETLRELIGVIADSFLTWGETEIQDPWLFSAGRDRPGSGIGPRWDQLQDAIAGRLLGLLSESKESLVVKAAVLAELEAFAELMEMRLSGALDHDTALRIAVERFFALYTVVIPALAD